MAGSTTNLGLTKPTYSEDADIAVINTNMDTLDSKIGAVGSTSLQAQITSANQAIATINNKKTLVLSSANVTSDTFILGLDDGYYQVASSSSMSGYIPKNYGTLMVCKSGNSYGIFIFKSAEGGTYIRHCSSSNAWHDNWQELAPNEAIAKYEPALGDTLTDCNTAKDNGNYPIYPGTTSNMPANSARVLEVFKRSNSIIFQRSLCTDGTTYTRYTTDGGTAWSVWEELALNSNLVPSMLDVQNKSYTSGSIDDLPCGIYRIYNVVTQIPISVAGYCSCYLRENGTKLQVYTSDTNRTFTRTKVSGTWSNWEELALNSKMQAGSSTSLSTDLKQVTFPKAFSSAPAVIITPNSGSTPLSATVLNITTTGFYANVWKAEGTRAQADFQWIAMEK